MFEHRTKPLLSRSAYLARVARGAGIGLGLIVLSLGIGILGYHYFEHLPWIDAFANAAMILSDMGPLATLQTTAGKAFAGCYALFSGLIFIVIVGTVFAPVAHRFLHRFHLGADADTTARDADDIPQA